MKAEVQPSQTYYAIYLNDTSMKAIVIVNINSCFWGAVYYRIYCPPTPYWNHRASSSTLTLLSINESLASIVVKTVERYNPR